MYRIFLLFFFVSQQVCFAQDFHFSQQSHSPIHSNPAFTGDFSGTYRFFLNHRNQWFSVSSNPFKTFSVSVDGSFKKKRFAVGLVLIDDNTGNAHLNSRQIGLPLAMSLTINQYNSLRFGLMTTFVQNRIDLSDLTWNSQYDGKKMNPEIESGEITSSVKQYFDFSSGISLMHFFKNGATWKISWSAYHLTRPQYSFVGRDDRASIRWRIESENVIQLSKISNTAIIPQATYQKQGSHSEIVLGALYRYKLGMHSRYTNFSKNSFVSLGAYCRVNDAVILFTGYEFREWLMCGLSYDLNTSKLISASKTIGAVEISLSCLISKKNDNRN